MRHEGQGWLLAVFPLVATIVAAGLGAMLTGRYLARRRPHEGVWAAALFMYAAASFAAVLGVARGWDPWEYRVYWLLGVALNVPFLAQGELYLLVRRRWVGHATLAVLLATTVLAVGAVLTDLRVGQLSSALPRGRDVWGNGSPAYALRWLSWIGYLALLAGLVWSAWKMRGRPHLRERTAGVLGIAFGATIVAIATGVGGVLELVWLFSVGLAAGISTMFWGFVRASRPGRPPPVPAPERAPEDALDASTPI